ncbi:hypothetical protein KP509_26G058300 [Ceratopteris richardii]|uniref:Transmembrane protein n=1 Tax=Ceratopteris richardii TaxID=49495 RepID=A0A8T2RP15_CERRI|nr:hypothetical protein KP509_26G058300 [Ceratopteris richardii]KAH7297194.1 hypothetical protein KP509_26G058300 [Ceratopteris richardii]
MRTPFIRRIHAEERIGRHDVGDILYKLKSCDVSQGLMCLFDGTSESLECGQNFGCHFGYNSYLDYGAELTCSEFLPIGEIRRLIGLSAKKSNDADWKGILYQHQSSANLSTLLVSKIMFDGSLVMDDVVPVSEIRESHTMSAMPLCPHTRRNRSLQVRMSSAMISNSLSMISLKRNILDPVALCPSRMNPFPFRSFLNRDESMVSIIKNAKRDEMISSRPALSEDFCLAFMSCENGSILSEKTFLETVSFSARTMIDTVDKRHDTKKSLSHESFPSMLNRIDEKDVNIQANDERQLERSEKEIETIGKALCHAQTRARLAETLVKQTLQENKVLEQLLVRETRTAYSYKQRAHALELENRVLKFYSRIRSGSHAGRKKVNTDRKEMRSSGAYGKKKCRPRRQSPLLFALGFAFMLGLSIAGMGIAILSSVGSVFF